MKDEIKIRLITLLSESLTNTHARRTAAEGKDEATEKFIRKYYGAWKGDVPAEEIIAKIQEGKTCRQPKTLRPHPYLEIPELG